ncbi:MAG TPA: threonine dehydratase [Burkholderiales bacterium]|nr:threonine dehydratase [Burkholderiales bacterium]
MISLPSLSALDAAAQVVYEALAPTPQYRWPLLCEALGADLWTKHENHTPIGAFKVRGGLNYFHHLAQQARKPAGVISATRGNHGQSVALAAARYGITAVIVVPHGNSVEKNAAMRALGAELIEHGDDFQAAREHAQRLAEQRGLLMVPSFDPRLVNGVASYSLELLRAVPDLDIVYVPIGLGSGICGMIAAREALSRTTQIVGVVSTQAAAYARSFAQHAIVESPVTTRIADGMACRVPEAGAMEWIWRYVERIVEVSDAEIEAAMRLMFTATHNVAEGAGAAGLAAALQERDRLRGRKVGFVVSGGNVDRHVYARIIGAA